jgi:DNA-binding NarL/FixJ family response regulator
MGDPELHTVFALLIPNASDDVIGIVRTGARGLRHKAITGPNLVAAVELVYAGDAYFSPRLAGMVLDAFRRWR